MILMEMNDELHMCHYSSRLCEALARTWILRVTAARTVRRTTVWSSTVVLPFTCLTQKTKLTHLRKSKYRTGRMGQYWSVSSQMCSVCGLEDMIECKERLT